MLLILKKPHEPVNIFDHGDIANALNAVCGTANGVLDHVPSSPEAIAYKTGLEHALSMVAVAFGLDATFSKTTDSMI